MILASATMTSHGLELHPSVNVRSILADIRTSSDNGSLYSQQSTALHWLIQFMVLSRSMVPDQEIQHTMLAAVDTTWSDMPTESVSSLVFGVENCQSANVSFAFTIQSFFYTIHSLISDKMPSPSCSQIWICEGVWKCTGLSCHLQLSPSLQADW